ncbi:kinase-like domain containing protein [Naviculisporaceae sp. PSN 640]
MAPDDDGWTTVPLRVGGERLLSRAELEAYERQILKEWEASDGHWSGIGKHTPDKDFAKAKKLHDHRFKRSLNEALGSGSFGLVEKVHYVYSNRTICLARKYIRYQRGRTIELLREEANVMEKLDHEHIVKLVGTYCVRPNELFILLWPVAVCNLDQLFNDLDALQRPEHEDGDVVARLEALELGQSGEDIRNYLRQITGCIAHAVAYCHEANIRHLDLKPSNILLNPGRVYLADFGIARDVHDRDCTMTIGAQGTPKWRAPEILNQNDEWSMKAADVYSLGLILLNIATVLYHAELVEFDNLISELSLHRRAEELKAFISDLEPRALATQTVADPDAPTFGPRHFLRLIYRMLSTDASQRPVATQVDAELVELGGLEQIYHSSCCKRTPRHLTERMNNILKLVTEDRSRLLSENQAIVKEVETLRRKDETYETRIQKERNTHADRMAKLQAQLDYEKAERKKLEALLEGLKRDTGAGRRNAPTRQSISRQGAAAPAGRPMPSASVQGQHADGLTMRTRSTHPPIPKSTTPLPRAQPQPQPIRKPSIHTTAQAAAAHHPYQPTYLAQTAASANRTATPPTAGPLRRVSMPRAAASSPGPQSLHPLTNSPIPGAECPSPAIGYPLRSRSSGSRLPQPVNPATPIRSGTPTTLVRDLSSTDSTQGSMISSTFSRRSGHSMYSAADTSAAGTPAMQGSPFADKSGNGDRRLSNIAGAGLATTSPESTEQETAGAGLGIGLGIDMNHNNNKVPVPRRGSNISQSELDRTSIHITSPILSAGMGTGPGSVVSTMSSPKANAAVLDPQSGRPRIPALPTARSWAEVARPVGLAGAGGRRV